MNPALKFAQVVSSTLGNVASGIEVVSAVNDYIDRKEAEANYRRAFIRAASATIDDANQLYGARNPLRIEVVKMMTTGIDQTVALALGAGGNTGQGSGAGWSRRQLAGSLAVREERNEGISHCFYFFMDRLAMEMSKLLNPEMAAAVTTISLRMAFLSSEISELRTLTLEGRSPQISLLGRLREPKTDIDLLQPYSLSTKFIGAGPQQELNDLFEWLQSDQRISVSLVGGRAGSGKTRLAIELCLRAINELRWRAGFLEGTVADHGWRWGRDTLIVIDYAADRADAINEWLKAITHADDLRGDGPKLRVLAMEREISPGTGWHARAFGRVSEQLLTEGEPLPLTGLGAEEAFDLFNDVLAKKGRPPLPGSEQPQFEERRPRQSWGGQPLFIMMAALTANSANALSAFALSRTDLAYAVAREEAEHLPSDAARRVAAIATIIRGCSVAEVRRALIEDWQRRGKGVVDADAAVRAVQQRLGGVGTDSVGFVEPDIVGAALVIGVVEPGGFRRNSEDASCRDALDLFAALAADFDGPTVPQFVIRAAQDFAWEGDRRPIDWLTTVAAQAGIDQLIEITALIPHSTLGLRSAAVDLNSRIVELAKETSNIALVAAALTNLSHRQSDLGQFEEALLSSLEAVRIDESLAANDPEGHSQGLAISLSALSNRLARVGRDQEALSYGRRAVNIMRENATGSSRSRTQTATVILDFARLLMNSPQHFEEALVASRAALEILREECGSESVPTRELVASLCTLAVMLKLTGDLDESLRIAAHAVSNARDLNARLPDVGQPLLAQALNNWSWIVSDTSELGEAIAAGQEAIVLLLPLARTYPESFAPELLIALSNLSTVFRHGGLIRDSLSVIVLGMDELRAWAQVHPERYLKDYALWNYLGALHLSELNEIDSAIEALEGAIMAFRAVRSLGGELCEEELAVALLNLANLRCQLFQFEESRMACAEVIALCSGRALGAAGVFGELLEYTFSLLADVLRALGREEEALAAEAEAAALDQ